MLDLFPSAYLDTSLLSAVLIGVLLTWLLGELLGWPQSGLVVPGYLGAVLLVRPSAGIVIFIEAIATYLLSHLLGRTIPERIGIGRIFGRDRFFLIILSSIIVRLFFEAGPLRWIVAAAGLELSEGWYSLGLVIVPLAANTLWKPGLIRGGPLLALPILLLYAILRAAIVPLTNLNLNQLELTYEDLAWSFLSTPSTYITLLAGTFIASHVTIRYGWDFGGIIVCGLLAILWRDPAHLAVTLAEALALAAALGALIRWTPIGRINLAGNRPLVLAFVVGFFGKWLFAWGLELLDRGGLTHDIFGFGYMLTAILGVRIWRRGGILASFGQVIGPTVMVSFFGFFFGGVIAAWVGSGAATAPSEGADAREMGDRAALIALDHVQAPSGDVERRREEIALAAWAAREGRSWSGEGIRVSVQEDGAAIFGEFGAAWLRSEASRPLVLAFPGALAPGIAEAGLALAEALDARAVLLGVDPALERALQDPSWGTLRVEIGGAPGLTLEGSLPEGLDLKALAANVRSTDLRRGSGGALLTLSEEDILSLALRFSSAPAVSKRAQLYDPDGRPAVAAPHADTSLPAIDRCVLQPLILGATEDPRWVWLASSHAARFGLQVFDDGAVVSLGPAPDAPPPWTTLWIRRGEASPRLFIARAAGREVGTAESAQVWWAASDAAALMVHDARGDADNEGLRRQGPRSLASVIARRIALEMPALAAIEITSFREDEAPGADAILTLGRPLGAGDARPLLADELESLVAGLGGEAGWYDGTRARLRFYDPANYRRAAVEAAGGTWSTVYLSPWIRRRMSWSRALMPALLATSGVPEARGSLETLSAGERIRAPRSAGTLLRALEGARSRGDPGAVVAAVGRGAMIFDPESGQHFALVERPGARLITPLGWGRGQVLGADEALSSVEALRRGWSVALERR